MFMKMKAFLPLIALLFVSCGGKHITVAAPGTPGWNPAACRRWRRRIWGAAWRAVEVSL